MTCVNCAFAFFICSSPRHAHDRHQRHNHALARGHVMPWVRLRGGASKGTTPVAPPAWHAWQPSAQHSDRPPTPQPMPTSRAQLPPSYHPPTVQLPSSYRPVSAQVPLSEAERYLSGSWMVAGRQLRGSWAVNGHGRWALASPRRRHHRRPQRLRLHVCARHVPVRACVHSCVRVFMGARVGSCRHACTRV